MIDEKFTAWMTRYALSAGIKRVDATERGLGMVSWRDPDCFCEQFAHGNDWHRTKEAALARAEQMRTRKIAALEKQIKQLKSMKFE